MRDNPDDLLNPIIHPISAKTEVILRRQGIKTVRQLSLLSYQECNGIRNIGNKTMTELTAVLQMYGLDWQVTPCAICGHRSKSMAGLHLHLVAQHPENIKLEEETP